MTLRTTSRASLFKTVRRSTAAVAVATLCALTAPVYNVAAQPVDPALEQRVSADEPVITGDPVIINQGHVDLGPYLDAEGHLQFLARDDASPEPVWRPTDEVTFGVSDKAKLQVPDDSNYDFIGAKAGKNVWVVPQTEIEGVPWVGWNTQSPTIKDIAVKGVSLEFVGHAGPGQHSLFLQPGGFAAPDVLWTQKDPGSIWVEPNTHTHANWVFTEPGSHLIVLRATVETPSGEKLTADAHLRFAVGIDPMTYKAPDPKDAENKGFPVWAIVVIGVLVAVAVVGGAAFAVVRSGGKRTKSAGQSDEKTEVSVDAPAEGEQ